MMLLSSSSLLFLFVVRRYAAMSNCSGFANPGLLNYYSHTSCSNLSCSCRRWPMDDGDGNDSILTQTIDATDRGVFCG